MELPEERYRCLFGAKLYCKQCHSKSGVRREMAELGFVPCSDGDDHSSATLSGGHSSGDQEHGPQSPSPPASNVDINVDDSGTWSAPASHTNDFVGSVKALKANFSSLGRATGYPTGLKASVSEGGGPPCGAVKVAEGPRAVSGNAFAHGSPSSAVEAAAGPRVVSGGAFAQGCSAGGSVAQPRAQWRAFLRPVAHPVAQPRWQRRSHVQRADMPLPTVASVGPSVQSTCVALPFAEEEKAKPPGQPAWWLQSLLPLPPASPVETLLPIKCQPGGA